MLFRSKYYLRHLPLVLCCLAVALLSVALARPQSAEHNSNSTTEGIDIVLSLDVSGSMLARDFTPDRLGAAKEVASNFIVDRPNDRIGLVVFAGESFTQCPLTTDKRSLLNLLGGVRSGMIDDGTAIGNGLATAVNRLRESSAKSKVVILLTDGVNNSGQIAPLTAAEIAKSYGIRVYTVGVGTMGMAPYPAIDMWGNLTFQPMKDRPMYFDCANEHGLAIAGLNFPGYASFVHEPVEGTENVATFEFPLWVARNFDSVDEVEEALRNVTLVSQIVPGQQESLLHWFIGDGKRSIVVEQMADGMHVHHDDVDVLTNQPTFDFHMENLRNYMCVSNEMAEPTSWGKASLTAWGAGVGMHGIPGDVSSPSRFVRVAYTNAHYPQQNDEAANVSRLFHTLGSVQMVDGMAKMGDGQFERTLFTSGYSSKTNTYYMNTYDDPAIRSYAMADYDMDSSELISVAR